MGTCSFISSQDCLLLPLVIIADGIDANECRLDASSTGTSTVGPLSRACRLTPTTSRQAPSNQTSMCPTRLADDALHDHRCLPLKSALRRCPFSHPSTPSRGSKSVPGCRTSRPLKLKEWFIILRGQKIPAPLGSSRLFTLALCTSTAEQPRIVARPNVRTLRMTSPSQPNKSSQSLYSNHQSGWITGPPSRTSPKHNENIDLVDHLKFFLLRFVE